MTKITVKKTNIDKIKNYVFLKNQYNINIYQLHNSYHLGDSIFNFIFFYLIKDYIEKNNIKIFYYAKKEYLTQLKEFICSKNIFLSSLENKPSISNELWIDNPYFDVAFSKQKFPVDYNKYYKIFFNSVLKKLNINISIHKFFYEDYDLINRYNIINNKYKHLDILIVNSQPCSGQYNYNKQEWDTYILMLSAIFKIVTTSKVQDLICTTDDNLTVKDIGAISTSVKVIIAINSGVVPALLNIYTLKNINKVYILDNRCYYSYPNFENKNVITDISIGELKKYI